MSLLPGVGYTLTELEGIALVMRIAAKPKSRGGLDCAFRMLNQVDYGIDAQIEFTVPTERGLPRATGRILSLQIKAGPSYFCNELPEGYRVYFNKSTVEYWKSHSAPVLVVIVDLDKNTAYWVRGDAAHQENDNGYSIKVPKSNTFDSQHWYELREMASSETQLSELFTRGRFEMALPWLMALDDGDAIEVDIETLDNQAPQLKRVTIRYRLSAAELIAPEYVADKEALERRSVEESYYCDTFINVRDLVDMLFDWAVAKPMFDGQAYEEEFEGLREANAAYDPPRTDEESGLSSFEHWVDSKYLNADEQIYWRYLDSGGMGYTFSLKLNDRGKRLLGLLLERELNGH